MKGLLLALRRLNYVNHRDDRRLARKWQDRLANQPDPEMVRLALAFQARFGVSRRRGAILLGRHLLVDPAVPVGMSVEELLSQHGWVTGATGSGKTFYVLSQLVQLLRRPRSPLVIIDMKGELSRLLQETIIPGLLGEPDATIRSDQIRIIRPYGSPYIPLLRLTEPEPGIPAEVQALSLASSLEEALGRDLGIRMERLWLKLCCLAIELREPLTTIHQWLENPVTLARDALRSADPRLRAYVRQSFEKETESSREALLARLDSFFLLSETRLALSAPRCLSFGDCLESGITIINLGEPPAGAERVSRFWAGVLVGRLTRAIMSRPVTANSPQTLVILEEFQEAISGGQIEQFKRLLALARFKRVVLWFVQQQASQIAAIDPALPRILRTNTGFEAIFRCNAEDARLLAPVLGPQTPRRGVSRSDPIREFVNLKDREFMFWSKRESFGPQRIRSLDLDMEAFHRAARLIDRATRLCLEQGSVAVPRRQLEALARTREAEPLVDGLPLLTPPAAPRGANGRFPGLG